MGRVRQSYAELSASIECISEFVDDHLPSGWMLDLSFLDGVFSAHLYDPGGRLFVFPPDGESLFWDCALKAVNHARLAESLEEVKLEPFAPIE